MRIGIDGRLWDQTGVGRYIRNLVYNLLALDKDNEYVIFALSKDKQQIESQIYKLKIKNLKLKIVAADIRWHSLEEQIKFLPVLNKENLDLMHFPYFSIPVFYKRPYIVTVHDLIVHHFPTGKASTKLYPLYKIKLQGYKLVIKKAAENAKKIITVSNATKMEIADHLGIDKNKIVVIYNGVDENIKHGISNTRYLKTKYFLYVGNAYPHKNLETLLLAFKELLKGKNNLKLVLAGRQDYFYRRLLKRIGDLGLSENVVLEQQIDDSKLQNLYANALALIQPSLMEGFGLPAVEAMANKCLVLASDIPSLKEICEDSAVYFNPYSVEDLKDKMDKVCSSNSGNWDKNKEKGFEIAKKFSWEKAAKETLDVYKEALSL